MGLEVKNVWLLGPLCRTSQVTSSAAACRAEALPVLPIACRCDPCTMGNLIPGWTTDHGGPGDHRGEHLKLFWGALAGC